MNLKRPILGMLNQGTIFSCARSDGYRGCNVYGLVVTARCDIQQDKYPVLNYIPVVALNDWLARDGFEILHSRAHKDVSGRVKSTLKSANISESVLFSQSPRDVLNLIFKDPDAPTGIKRLERKFSETVEAFEFLEGVESANEEHIVEVFRMHPALSKSLLKELTQHKVSGYYFLPSVMPGDGGPGYVALMREVSHLPRMLAKQIGQGLDKEDLMLHSNSDWSAYVAFDHEPFAMPIGEIGSPAIEHILQTFGALFGRIGLEDLEADYVDAICERIPQQGLGGSQ